MRHAIVRLHCSRWNAARFLVPSIGALLPGFLLAAFVTPAVTSVGIYVQVAQPHDQPEAGSIGLMYVTYELMMGSPSPGLEIRYTCAPGASAVDRGGYSGVENRNGANRYGFKVRVEDLSDPRRWRGHPGEQFVDTLTVTLDVRTAARKLAEKIAPLRPSSADLYQRDFDGTLQCTVDCILDNATRSYPAIYHLRLRIAGPAKYGDLAKVYEITPAPRKKAYN